MAEKENPIPLIQIDDDVREMTVEEIAELEALRADFVPLPWNEPEPK